MSWEFRSMFGAKPGVRFDRQHVRDMRQLGHEFCHLADARSNFDDLTFQERAELAYQGLTIIHRLCQGSKFEVFSSFFAAGSVTNHRQKLYFKMHRRALKPSRQLAFFPSS